jgi:uncharacterized protein (DUF2147 family)
MAAPTMGRFDMLAISTRERIRPATVALTAALAVLAVTGAASADGRGPLGRWITEGGKSHVEIARCGEQLCGTIIWLKEPLDDGGQPKTDKNNKDEALRDRPILGLALLNGFGAEPVDGKWTDGKIYNPEDGETYSATMNLLDARRLKVRGYVGLPLFGKSQEWTRVEAK